MSAVFGRAIGAKTEVIGTHELSAWLVTPGVTWAQTRSPQFARKLSQRSDSRLVANGVAGGYLRTFEFSHGLSWAKRLIVRYTAAVTPTNARVLNPAAPLNDVVFETGPMQPAADAGQNSAQNDTVPPAASNGKNPQTNYTTQI